MKKKTYHATWKYIPDPLFYTTCPHCGAGIFMSSPTVIKRLLNWAKGLKK